MEESSWAMVRDRESVLDTLRREAPTLRALGVQRLSLFGSTVRGESRPESDMDFLVDLVPKSFDTYMDVKEHLESCLGCRVDLVLRTAVKPELRDQILREAVDAALG